MPHMLVAVQRLRASIILSSITRLIWYRYIYILSFFLCMPAFGGNDADHALIVAIVNRYRHTSRTRFRMPPAWHSDGDADNVATVAVTFVRCHVYIIHAIHQLHQLHAPLLTVSCILLSSSLNSTELHLRGIAENTDPLQPIEWEAGRWERVEIRVASRHVDVMIYIIIYHYLTSIRGATWPGRTAWTRCRCPLVPRRVEIACFLWHMREMQWD